VKAHGGGIALYLVAVAVPHPLSPRSLPKSALAMRLGVAAFASALALAGTALSPPVLVGLLALALVGLTFFEVGRVGRTTEAPGLPLPEHRRKES
jgi:hypothetical protein